MVPRVWMAITTILAAIAVYAGIWRPVILDPLSKPPVAGPMPECRHDWTGDSSAATLDNFLGRIRDVAEFHDCQRLIAVDNQTKQSKYGVLAAVFARPSLDTVSFTAMPASAAAVGSGSGFVVPGTLPAPRVIIPPTASLDGYAVLGLLYLPYGGAYEALGVKTPLSCIVISPQLDAWLVPEDRRSEKPCAYAINVAALNGSPILKARVAYLSTTGGAEIPPVARWDFDTVRGEQYIGIRCGQAWCEIGKEGFSSSAGYSGSPTSPSEKHLAVKGWYDEQFLAHFPESGITPGGNLGTVVPTAQLEQWTKLDEALGRWIPAAKVYMRPSAGPYAAEMNFAGSSQPLPNGPMATISLCRGTTKDCLPRNRFARFRATSCGLADNDLAMFGAISRPGEPPKYVCVKYRHHGANAIIPAVVRWRWRPDDETIWIRCPEGCCEIQAN